MSGSSSGQKRKGGFNDDQSLMGMRMKEMESELISASKYWERDSVCVCVWERVRLFWSMWFWGCITIFYSCINTKRRYRFLFLCSSHSHKQLPTNAIHFYSQTIYYQLSPFVYSSIFTCYVTSQERSWVRKKTRWKNFRPEKEAWRKNSRRSSLSISQMHASLSKNSGSSGRLWLSGQIMIVSRKM